MRRTGQTPLKFQLDGHTISAPLELANCQMKHYQKKLQNLVMGLPATQQDPLEHLNIAMERWSNSIIRETFHLKSTTEPEVLKIMMGLGNSTASGLDGQDDISIKAIAGSVVKPLTHLINMSINQSRYANRWKLSKILPLYKGKQKPRDKPNSYRPISLLSVSSNIAEHVVQKQLADFLTRTNQLNPNQHLYQANHSTTTAWAQLTDSLFEATDLNLI